MNDRGPSGAVPLTLPPIPDPSRYAGLYVYDFGTHVSVGYTAAEIRILRESAEHAHGTAYEIYRIGDRGTIELRAAGDERLTGSEAICFLRPDAADARRDYDAIEAAAKRAPLSCGVAMRLATLDVFDPPHVTGLSYPASATMIVSRWLTENVPDAGNVVVGGMDTYATLTASADERIASCTLAVRADYADRPADVVLAAVREALQR